MQIRVVLSVIAAALSLSASAFAQDEPPERQQFDLSALARLLNPGGPNWSGRAAYPPVPGAVGHVYTGSHGVGDVIAEIDVAPTRIARLNQAVTIANAEYGDLTLVAGATLVARNGEQVEVRPGAPHPVVTNNGPMQWCILEGVATPVCISMRGESEAEYREQTGANPRTWRGVPPVFTEEQISFDPPMTWQLAVVRIEADQGIALESRFGRAGQRVRERGYGVLPFGSVVRSSERIPGLPGFRVRRGRSGQVVIEHE